MRRRGFLMVGLFLGFFAAGSWTIHWLQTRHGIGAPRIDCPTYFDLGEKEIGQMVSQPFYVLNRGTSPLTLYNVRSSCACTGLTRKGSDTYERIEETTIEAGGHESLFIRVRVVNDKDSSSDYYITFLTNDPSQPEVSVKLHVRRARTALEFRPAHLSLGRLDPGQLHRFQVQVYDAPENLRKISSFYSNLPDAVRLEYVANTLVADHAESGAQAESILFGTLHLDVQCDSAMEIMGEIILVTDQDGNPPGKLTVSGSIRPWLEVAPRSLILPRRSQYGWIFRAVLVCRFPVGNQGTVEVQGGENGLTATLEKKGSDFHVLIVLDPENPMASEELNLTILWKLGTRSGKESVQIVKNSAWQAER